jgi:hypothetical protein
MPGSEQKVKKTTVFNRFYRCTRLEKAQKPAILQRTPVPGYSPKTLKTFAKYIALIPADVVQHGLIAGSCRPLIVLFIVYWFLFFLNFI